MPLRDQGMRVAARATAKSLNQLPLLLVVAIAAIGMVLVWIGHWRWGAALVGIGLCFGAAERLVLSKRSAGLLQVRTRAFDVTVLLSMGVAVIALAAAVPS